jgi:hypothetical protein
MLTSSKPLNTVGQYAVWPVSSRMHAETLHIDSAIDSCQPGSSNHHRRVHSEAQMHLMPPSSTLTKRLLRQSFYLRTKPRSTSSAMTSISTVPSIATVPSISTAPSRQCHRDSAIDIDCAIDSGTIIPWTEWNKRRSRPMASGPMDMMVWILGSWAEDCSSKSVQQGLQRSKQEPWPSPPYY